nr:uncharacterized protein LOC109184430 [Ipomoea batatas]
MAQVGNSRYAHLGNAYVSPGRPRLGNAHLEFAFAGDRKSPAFQTRVWEMRIAYILEPHFRNTGFILYSYTVTRISQMLVWKKNKKKCISISRVSYEALKKEFCFFREQEHSDSSDSGIDRTKLWQLTKIVHLSQSEMESMLECSNTKTQLKENKIHEENDSHNKKKHQDLGALNGRLNTGGEAHHRRGRRRLVPNMTAKPISPLSSSITRHQ